MVKLTLSADAIKDIATLFMTGDIVRQYAVCCTIEKFFLSKELAEEDILIRLSYALTRKGINLETFVECVDLLAGKAKVILGNQIMIDELC